jgi:hypothetical protein
MTTAPLTSLYDGGIALESGGEVGVLAHSFVPIVGMEEGERIGLCMVDAILEVDLRET